MKTSKTQITAQKTKKMNNTIYTKKPGMNSCASEGSTVTVSYKKLIFRNGQPVRNEILLR